MRHDLANLNKFWYGRASQQDGKKVRFLESGLQKRNVAKFDMPRQLSLKSENTFVNKPLFVKVWDGTPAAALGARGTILQPAHASVLLPVRKRHVLLWRYTAQVTGTNRTTEMCSH